MWENWPARKLPEVDIAGIKFYLDLRLNECREITDFSNRFSLDELYGHGSGYIFCFDVQTKKLFEGSKQEYELRKHELKIIRWPSLQKLDPVGFRALMGLPPKKEKQTLLQKKRNRKSKGKKL
ncbi:MAG: hypothetical protein V4539_01340 [Bacteroidota bacterium]